MTSVVIFAAFGLPAGAQQLPPSGQAQLVLLTKLSAQQCHGSQACLNEAHALATDWQKIMRRVSDHINGFSKEPYEKIKEDGETVLDQIDAWGVKYHIVASPQETTGSGSH